MATPQEYLQPEPIDPLEQTEVQQAEEGNLANVIQLHPYFESAGKTPAEIPLEWQKDYQTIQAARTSEKHFDALVNKYIGFIKYITNGYFLAGGEQEDLYQEGLYGFFKAVRDYDGERSSFKVFAALCIERQVITAIKTAVRYKNMPLNNYLSFSHTPNGEANDMNVGDSIASIEPAVEEIVASKESISSLVEHIKSSLSELESETLRLFLDDYSYEEMAAILGVNEKTIDNAIMRVKRKIITYQKKFEGQNLAKKVVEIKEKPEYKIRAPLEENIDPIELASQALAKLKAAGLRGVV